MKGCKVKHGHAKKGNVTAIWRIWAAMRARCTKPYASHYSHYGARGIKFCDRWKDFKNFLADMGERPPGTSIERIDNDGNYCPENCRWATKLEQMQNCRTNRKITINGTTKILEQWCREVGVSSKLVGARINNLGWSEEKALFTPAMPKGKLLCAKGHPVTPENSYSRRRGNRTNYRCKKCVLDWQKKHPRSRKSRAKSVAHQAFMK